MQIGDKVIYYFDLRKRLTVSYVNGLQVLCDDEFGMSDWYLRKYVMLEEVFNRLYTVK